MSINESQFRHLLDRYLNGTATEEEKKIVDEFFASYVDEHPEEGPERLNDKKRRIFLKINERLSAQRQTPFYFKSWFKAAAAVSLIMLSLWIYQRVAMESTVVEQKDVAFVKTESTRRGEKMVLELPDGTKVHMNANSSISYSPSFTESRAVTLRGEAYFEVTHDPSRPFTVQARSSSVKVLGTTFNVNATADDQVAVTLVTGKVNVNSPAQEVVMEPGYQAVVDTENVITREKVNVDDFIGWKDNVLVFRETPLEKAVLILGDWYDAKIEIRSSALKACTISGQYKDESLENVIKSFEFLLKAKAIFKDEKNISLNGKGCKL